MASILTETRGRVGIVTLNRPQALNALNAALIAEIAAAVAAYDADDGIGAIVITGSEKAFAAGADIKEMSDPAFAATYFDRHAGAIEKIAGARKPIVAAVAGFALGGGCELALLCDIVIAADTAKIRPARDHARHHSGHGRDAAPAARRRQGQGDGHDPHRPHDRRGRGRARRPRVARGAGGGAHGHRARRRRKIASFSLPSVMKAKEAVALAAELPLAEGIRAEQRLFHALFATDDQKEGMAAFIAKRAPNFRNR